MKITIPYLVIVQGLIKIHVLVRIEVCDGNDKLR